MHAGQCVGSAGARSGGIGTGSTEGPNPHHRENAGYKVGVLSMMRMLIGFPYISDRTTGGLPVFHP